MPNKEELVNTIKYILSAILAVIGVILLVGIIPTILFLARSFYDKDVYFVFQGILSAQILLGWCLLILSAIAFPQNKE